MTRMKLNLWAKPVERRYGAREVAKQTFSVIFSWTYIAVYLNVLVLICTLLYEDLELYGEGLVFVLRVICAVLLWPLALFAMYWTTRTRSYIRQKYCIPARYCGSSNIESLQASTRSCHIEDFCCSFCCICCTVSQMARHTMDYDTYPAACCTNTGIRDSVPDVVWSMYDQCLKCAWKNSNRHVLIERTLL